MLKTFGALLVILSCSTIGLYYSSLVRGRVADLRAMKKNITLLRGDIKYGNTNLPEAIGALSRKNSDNFQPFFAGIEEDLLVSSGLSFATIWENGIKNYMKSTYMNQQDREQIKHLGENLGYLDKEMQLKTIDLYIEQLDHELNDSVATMKDKTRLYNMLGILSGLFLTVVLI